MKTKQAALPDQIRKEGPTPNGGAYSILTYTGKSKDGISGEITEYSKSGAEINRTYFKQPKK